MFKIVSWHTNDPYYSKVAQTFITPSLEKLNHPHFVIPVKGTNSWRSNTNLKPIVARVALETAQSDILLVDADAQIHHYPSLFDQIGEEYDMAVHYLDWYKWFNYPGEGKMELLSGTLFFRNRDICKRVIDAWGSSELNQKYADQRILENVIKDFPELKVFSLPIEYCWMHDLPNGNPPFIKRPDKVYIEHFQVSRQLKHKV